MIRAGAEHSTRRRRDVKRTGREKYCNLEGPGARRIRSRGGQRGQARGGEARRLPRVDARASCCASVRLSAANPNKVGADSIAIMAR